MNFITVDDEKINVSNVIQLMSILILIVWPQSLYQSFLVAKNGFINLNVISIITNIVLSILCYLVIEHLKCGIECYFLSMIICNLFNTTALYYYSWKRLSSDFSTVCKENFVNALKRFYSNSAGASLYSVSSLLFFQLPSITLSTAATTSDLGLYGLSLTFPMALITMLNPITSVFCNKVALISTRSHAMESFVEGTLIVYVFLIAGSIILFNNIDWIYVEWLGVGNVPNEIYRLFEILLLGSTAYGMTMIVTNTFLLNEQSLKLFICYVFAVASYIIRAALEYQNIDVMRVAILWRDSAFILLLSLIVALYSYSILLHKLNLRNLCLALAIGSVYYLISNYIVVLFLFKNLAAFGVWLVIGLLIYSPVVIRMARAI
jgi:O-antigen/teichoic acid export membrane protein